MLEVDREPGLFERVDEGVDARRVMVPPASVHVRPVVDGDGGERLLAADLLVERVESAVGASAHGGGFLFGLPSAASH